MNRVPHCSECKYLKMYDYVYKNYYCDNEDRIDDMGKLSVDHPPKTSPKWCPLREFDSPCNINKSMLGLGKLNEESEWEDIIQMKTDIELTDKHGNVIEVKTPKPEYLADSIF